MSISGIWSRKQINGETWQNAPVALLFKNDPHVSQQRKGELNSCVVSFAAAGRLQNYQTGEIDTTVMKCLRTGKSHTGDLFSMAKASKTYRNWWGSVLALLRARAHACVRVRALARLCKQVCRPKHLSCATCQTDKQTQQRLKRVTVGGSSPPRAQVRLGRRG